MTIYRLRDASGELYGWDWNVPDDKAVPLRVNLATFAVFYELPSALSHASWHPGSRVECSNDGIAWNVVARSDDQGDVTTTGKAPR